MRTAQISRKTKETEIEIFVRLDGEGRVNIDTGIGFFDHMLTAFGVHSGIDLDVRCKGDLYVDAHHSVEDTGICLGKAFAEALGDKINYQETNGLVDSKNIDGGRASEAMKLEPGQSSSKFISINGDGYYFVKLISKTDSQVNFVSIRVPFTKFNQQFDQLKENNQITEYITISDSSQDQQQ